MVLQQVAKGLILEIRLAIVVRLAQRAPRPADVLRYLVARAHALALLQHIGKIANVGEVSGQLPTEDLGQISGAGCVANGSA